MSRLTDTMTRPSFSMPRPTGGHQSQLFLVTSSDNPTVVPTRISLRDVDIVTIGRGDREIEVKQLGTMQAVEIRIPDGLASRRHAEIVWLDGRWMLSDAGSKNGTLVDGAVIDKHALSDGDVFEVGHTFFVFRDGMWQGEARAVEDEGALGRKPVGLASLVPALASRFDELARIATTKVPVLLQGESGTGKELAARALHDLSGRSGRFVPVNCGALPPNLVESLLFGHKRGAFSGAVADEPGFVRAASGGTLFLDEIGDLPGAAQAALLRVLQESEVFPVGVTRSIPVDLRVCAASHRNLEALVRKKEFREDLLARLAGFTLAMPAVRERREDLGLFLRAIVPRIAAGRAVSFDPAAMRQLFGHTWPRNVRELERVLESALALTRDGVIRAEDLRMAAPAPADDPAEDTDTATGTGEELDDETRRARLVELLQRHNGNISAVARDMGKARLQIRRWLKRYAIDAESYRRDG